MALKYGRIRVNMTISAPKTIALKTRAVTKVDVDAVVACVAEEALERRDKYAPGKGEVDVHSGRMKRKEWKVNRVYMNFYFGPRSMTSI
jgi:hypothetical protein